MSKPELLRHRAGVEALALEGDERVLEIGCGHGVAVRLLLERLSTGEVVALDRSHKMIDMVVAGSPEAVADGRLTALNGSFEAMRFPPQGFDAVLAINVDLTLRLGARWPELVKPLLKPGGVLVLSFDPPPGSRKALEFADSSRRRLDHAGFAVDVTAIAEGREEVTVITARA